MVQAFLATNGYAFVIQVAQAAQRRLQRTHLGLHLVPVLGQGGHAIPRLVGRPEHQGNQQQLPAPLILLGGGPGYPAYLLGHLATSGFAGNG